MGRRNTKSRYPCDLAEWRHGGGRWLDAVRAHAEGKDEKGWLAQLAGKPHWLVPALLEVFVDGLEGQAVIYPENNRTYHRVIMCELHEETNQSWCKTAMSVKIATTRDRMGHFVFCMFEIEGGSVRP
jgi:hypothetical protein